MDCKCHLPMFYDTEGKFHGCSCGEMYGNLDTITPGWYSEPEKMKWLRQDYRFKHGL